MTTKDPLIIKEYDDIYFIYKPPYWSCDTPNPGIKLSSFMKRISNDNTILKWIKNNLTLSKDILNCENCGYGLLNRLDYETSGIIMVAKNKEKYNLYRKNINDHKTTTKIYITLVNGIITHKFGIISLPLYSNKKINRTVVDEEHGKHAYTEYINLKTLSYKNKNYSLLAVKIKTGRTHQIRVHFKSIGHIIFCDKKYGDEKKLVNEECKLSNRLFLHATYYSLDSQKDGSFTLPTDLNDALNEMTVKKEYMNISNAIDILKSNCITNKFV